MIIKAPYIITLEGPPLKDHAIRVENGIIQAIAPQKEFSNRENCLDYPQTVLFPGLVNGHCHLELSQLPKPLPYPGSFAKWIEELGKRKVQRTPAQIEESIRFGIQKLLEGGTTTVADHASGDTPLEPLLESPLEGVAYIEVLGVEKRRAEEFYTQAMEKSKLQSSNFKINLKSKIQIIATPHAPYSLLPEVFSKLTSASLSIHIAESSEEYLLFKEKRGPLFDFLATKGETPSTLGETPVRYLARLNLLPKGAMAIHANYLEEEDIRILKRLEVSVVHCPGSHAYFGHDRFPLKRLQEAGIPIALGTDSLASNDSLSMFEQMRLALDTYAELTPETVLKMATLNGAKALNKEKEIGSLSPGKRANLLGIPLRSAKAPLDKNLLASDTVSFSMIRGQLFCENKRRAIAASREGKDIVS